jgi:hypothetical protein
MKQVDKISLKELQGMAESMYGDFVKSVVDIEKKLVVVYAEMHYDEEQFLLERGSKQGNLWGINLYPSKYGTEQFIEFDSMINVRPSQNNRSRGVESHEVRKKIEEVVLGVVHE